MRSPQAYLLWCNARVCVHTRKSAVMCAICTMLLQLIKVSTQSFVRQC